MGQILGTRLKKLRGLRLETVDGHEDDWVTPKKCTAFNALKAAELQTFVEACIEEGRQDASTYALLSAFTVTQSAIQSGILSLMVSLTAETCFRMM